MATQSGCVDYVRRLSDIEKKVIIYFYYGTLPVFQEILKACCNAERTTQLLHNTNIINFVKKIISRIHAIL